MLCTLSIKLEEVRTMTHKPHMHSSEPDTFLQLIGQKGVQEQGLGSGESTSTCLPPMWDSKLYMS